MKGKVISMHATERRFECPICKEKVTAYKKSSRRTKAGHIKHMWCYKCKAIQGFIQIKY